MQFGRHFEIVRPTASLAANCLPFEHYCILPPQLLSQLVEILDRDEPFNKCSRGSKSVYKKPHHLPIGAANTIFGHKTFTIDPQLKVTKTGVVLVPQPTDDERDPLVGPPKNLACRPKYPT